MRNLVVCLIVFLVSLDITGQTIKTGVGTDLPLAVLDVRAIDPISPDNSTGVSIPKVFNFPVVDPIVDQNGMLIFYEKEPLSTDTKLDGFYYWDNPAGNWEYIMQSKSIKLDFSKTIAMGSVFDNTMGTGSGPVKTSFTEMDNLDPDYSLNNGDVIVGKSGLHLIYLTAGVTKKQRPTDPQENIAESFTLEILVNGTTFSPSFVSIGANPSTLNNERSTTFTVSALETLSAGDALSVETARSSATSTNEVEVSSPYTLTLIYLE
ncbi:hypothetical protein OOZ15_00270 [Galbibacter sp. EGI 63066]|uniref:hypothetical protein n=1 Tax=Galbibacter sp. EGI 63066 TaxID=2993559 RepID=UPI0022494183|nr:hypothetical protein [Galbibacter sp. EGI 63066]MCX2678363.1 hypothetical protein [Galbibacter sp. EGI 63066]